MENVYVVGIGMTRFEKASALSFAGLANVAAEEALADSGVDSERVGMVFSANATEGLMTGQEMIRGQAAFQTGPLAARPVVNVENACASASSALHLATLAVRSGEVEVALVVGAEKMSHPAKGKALAALGSAVNLERIGELKEQIYRGGAPGSGSLFMDIYAEMAREYASRTAVTDQHFAQVVVKSHQNAVRNPRAQYQDEVSLDQVLTSRMVSDPLRLLMCSPVGDGAAALVVASERAARQLGRAQVRVAASVVVAGSTAGSGLTAVERASRTAYEKAGIGPEDVSLAEVHDAAAPAELIMYEELGLCAAGEGPRMLETGESALGGRLPVNVGGGLISRGHPIGATGAAQIVELTEQLRGVSGSRQVEGAKVGLAENAGGYLGPDPAAVCVTLLTT